MKRLWWSIANLDKYDEMMDLGLKKAIRYFFALIAVFSIILATVYSYLQINLINELRQYINDNAPEFTVSKDENDTYILNTENKDAIILEDDILKKVFGSSVIVNTNLGEKEAINEYYKLTNDNNNCIIFLKDECVIISSKYNIDSDSEVGMAKYTYNDLMSKFITTDNSEFDKEGLVNYFNNTSFGYYMLVYFMIYLLTLLIVFGMDAIIAGILSMIANIFLKLEKTKRQLFSMAIYALTLPSILYIIYLVTSSFTGYVNRYANIIYMTITYVYIILYFYRQKSLHKEK